MRYTRNLGLVTMYITIFSFFHMGCKAEGQKRDGQKPDIVIFISDDHGYDDSGAYGNKIVKTPNIDRLAEAGTLFINTFAASPLCSPSRCVIETGLMPFRNGAHKFNTNWPNGVKCKEIPFRPITIIIISSIN